MNEVTQERYNKLKLRHMRQWKQELTQKGYNANVEELLQMWEKFDNFTIVQSKPQKEIDWVKVRQNRSIEYWDNHQKALREMTARKRDVTVTKLRKNSFKNSKPNRHP
jgi:hypothetical protein